MQTTLQPTSVVNEIETIAGILMNTNWFVNGKIYNLVDLGWTFSFNTKKKALGTCNFRKENISLSKLLIASNEDIKLWDDTIRHEIAHAIDFLIRGTSDHSEQWKQVGRQVGCSTEILKASVKVKSVDGKYTLKCNVCEHTQTAHRKRAGKLACSKCCNTHNNGKYSEKYKLEVIQNY